MMMTSTFTVPKSTAICSRKFELVYRFLQDEKKKKGEKRKEWGIFHTLVSFPHSKLDPKGLKTTENSPARNAATVRERSMSGVCRANIRP